MLLEVVYKIENIQQKLNFYLYIYFEFLLVYLNQSNICTTVT